MHAVIFTGLAAGAGCHPVSTVDGGRDTAIVSRVVDGDTVELEGNVKIRYIGIDTPEIDTQDCFAEEAKTQNGLLVAGKTIEMEYDDPKLDRYGRTLAYVYVDGLFVNAKMVEQGYARAYPYTKGQRYEQLFADLEADAQAHNRGLWGICAP